MAWNTSDYSEKLKHPKWQKCRLEVLNAADWKCQSCGDTEETLEVHHLKYHKGEPWDTPREHLECLCSNCHDTRTAWDQFWGKRVPVPTEVVIEIIGKLELIFNNDQTNDYVDLVTQNKDCGIRVLAIKFYELLVKRVKAREEAEKQKADPKLISLADEQTDKLSTG